MMLQNFASFSLLCDALPSMLKDVAFSPTSVCFLMNLFGLSGTWRFDPVFSSIGIGYSFACKTALGDFWHLTHCDSPEVCSQ